MVTIDALITKKNEEFKLSDLGLEVVNFNVSSPQLEVDYRTVRNRSGRSKAGHRFDHKSINVNGYLNVDSLQQFKLLETRLNGLLVDEKGYYLTQLISVTDMFDYELPGSTTGDVDLLSSEHEPMPYRFNVINKGDLLFEFVGKSGGGLLYRFSMDFETQNLPYGETEPKTIQVTNSIPYSGTATNSQLESPWTARLVSNQAQPGDFYVTIGDRRFEHESLTQVKSGDVFELKGVETWLNKQNVNDYTNFEHFELEPTADGQITIDTNFKGSIYIDNYMEFYK